MCNFVSYIVSNLALDRHRQWKQHVISYHHLNGIDPRVFNFLAFNAVPLLAECQAEGQKSNQTVSAYGSFDYVLFDVQLENLVNF